MFDKTKKKCEGGSYFVWINWEIRGEKKEEGRRKKWRENKKERRKWKEEKVKD